MVKDLHNGGRLYLDGRLAQEGGRWLALEPAASLAARRDLSREQGVAFDQLPIGAERAAAALAVKPGEHERGHCAAANACSLGLGERLRDQRLDVVEALSGGRPRRRPPPPSFQCARAMRAASAAVSTRAETGGPPRAV